MLDDWRAIRLSDDTAVLTFEAEQEVVCNGTTIASEAVASSVYMMQDGVWKNAVYHETPIDDDDEDADDEGEDDEEHEDEDHEDDDGR